MDTTFYTNQYRPALTRMIRLRRKPSNLGPEEFKKSQRNLDSDGGRADARDGELLGADREHPVDDGQETSHHFRQQRDLERKIASLV